MADQPCPNCGEPLAAELGQHALTPTSGLVRCPSCGETVTLAHAGETAAGAPAASDDAAVGIDENVRDDYFAGEETVDGVMDELGEKEGGAE
jgi:endogenous inhibitor of DNA gyrase (YacG/DUF329 family)